MSRRPVKRPRGIWRIAAAAFESLEQRAYLTSASFSGTSGNDVASITAASGNVIVDINGQSQSLPASGLGLINISLGAGNDDLTIGVGVPPTSVSGGGGNDTIVASNSNDTVNGGAGDDLIDNAGAGDDCAFRGAAGNDTLSAANGGDTLLGGAGSDIFLTAGATGDSINGGAGLNFAQRNPADDNAMQNIAEIFDPTPPPANGAPAGQIVLPPQVQSVSQTVVGNVLEITGTSGNDTISVSSDGTNLNVTANGTNLASDPLSGLIGLQMNGQGGDDSITVDSSVTLPTTLKGGSGDDTLSGGGGDNVLIGGVGNDSLMGGAGENLLVPGQQTAFDSSPTGNDTLDGGGGYNVADFSHRTDALTLSNDGNPDSGDISAGEASQIMPNIQAILGGTGNDTITGTVGGEFLSGGAGADSIQGGGASDVLVGGKGADSVNVASEPVGLFLHDGRPDQYSGVITPSLDVLSIDPDVDLIPQTLTSPITTGNVAVTLKTVAQVDINTYGTPQDIASVPGDPSEQFVTTRNGYVLRLKNGQLKQTPLLSLPAAGISVYTGGEGGLLGLAICPTFNVPGTFGFDKFYTVDTEPFSTSTPADYSSPELYPTTDVDPNNQIVVREWTISSSNANLANTTSRVLLRIDHPQSNHQGGSLRFGPDGDLYIGLGDGGGGNDQVNGPDDPTDGHTNNIGNAQDLTVPFGKILRINPNPNAGGAMVSTNGQYSIPDDNPFASTTNGDLKEIYAYGLRNPYRMTFDSVTGQLYVSDVGQSNREEVDIITSGGNYGWPFLEGTRDNSGDYGAAPPAGFTSIPPIGEYTHGDGNAGIGADVYEGGDVPALDGDYLFGDLDGGPGGIARLFYMNANGGTIKEFTYTSDSAAIPGALYGISDSVSGEPYYLFSDGSIVTFA